MFRRLVACSAAALVALATPSSAAPPQVQDPKGDWHVPSQDVLTATLATDRTGRLVVTLKMAAPLAEVPGFYHVVLYRGCDAYVARLDWQGPTLPRTSALEVSKWCSGDIAPGVIDPRPSSVTTLPAAAAVTGDTITWTLPVVPGLGRGARIEHVNAVVMPNPKVPVGIWLVGTHIPPVVVHAFDVGYGERGYVVGG